MKMTKWLVVVCVVMSAGIADAQAQIIQWEDRGYLSVNFGIQPQSRDFTEVSAPKFTETRPRSRCRTISVPAPSPISPSGYRLWQNVGVHVGYSHFGKTEIADARRADPAPPLRRPVPDRIGQHRRSIAQRERVAHAPGLDDSARREVRGRDSLRAVVLQHQTGISSKRSLGRRRTPYNTVAIGAVDVSRAVRIRRQLHGGRRRNLPGDAEIRGRRVSPLFGHVGRHAAQRWRNHHGRGGWPANWRGVTLPILGRPPQASSLQLRLVDTH